jgi:predicted RNase H-like HicB family nuclease
MNQNSNKETYCIKITKLLESSHMKKQTLNIVTWKEDNWFVAKFLELELASQGKTKQEAINNLKEALDLYLEDEDTNRLDIPSIKEVATQTFSLN